MVSFSRPFLQNDLNFSFKVLHTKCMCSHSSGINVSVFLFILKFVTTNVDRGREQQCSTNLTFIGPRIVIYFYSKTNQMHNISNLFYFGTTLYMFRTFFPSIIRSLRLYIQHQVYVIQVLWLLASKQPQNLMLYVPS